MVHGHMQPRAIAQEQNGLDNKKERTELATKVPIPISGGISTDSMQTK